MISLSTLNSQQQEAVTTVEGPVMILAGAGSGKTRVIIQRIAHLIQNKQIPPKQILAVTFTNKAAEEMRERLQEMLAGKQKGVHLSTFHALGVSLLRKSIHHLGYRPNFIIYDKKDQFSVIKTIMEDHNFDDTGLIDAKSVHFEIGQAKSLGYAPEHFLEQQESSQKRILGQVYRIYQQTMKACNAIDFDDILNLTLTLFEKHPEQMGTITERFRYILVDEYQDTNRIQYKLLRHLTKLHRNLCVVGDDDQSIYGWRGAEVKNIFDFEQDFPGVKFIRLEQNYRSTQNILAAANQVISENTQRMPKKLWSAKQGGEKLDWLLSDSEAEEMEAVTRRIRTKIMQSGRRYADFSILYRSNFQSRAVEEALREAKIPYLLVGGTSFYDRQEVRDALAYLKVIHNQNDEVSLHRIVNTPRRGIGKTALAQANQCCHEAHLPLFKVMLRARKYENISKESALIMEMFAGIITNYQQRFASEPLGTVFRELLAEVGYLRYLETQSGDVKVRERRVQNVLELLQSVRKFSDNNSAASLQQYLERVMLFSENDNDSESKANQVAIMTFHSAKGLEFPFVFMIGMSEGVFPNQRSIDEDGEDEERRLCYVGITRAQEELTFSMAKSKQRYGEKIRQVVSRFLLDINPDLLTIPIIGEASEEVKNERRLESRTAFFSQFKQLETSK
ncbi:MAG: UvrD-helicase domain-containing protein [SAR324 cluster bacterium]|nr:UvrD-helicase domain-containing protein [SAR324 cluster bacterium]